MSVSQSNQNQNLEKQPFAWHLQAMGIDLYGVRDGIDEVAAVSEPASALILDKVLAKKPQLVVLSDLIKHPLISDICLLLNIDVDAIELLADNEFRLGVLQWQFVSPESQSLPQIDKHQLTTPPMEQLRHSEAKRALWSCLTTFFTANPHSYADIYTNTKADKP